MSVQIIPPSPRAMQGASLGQALGQGLGVHFQRGEMQNQQGLLAKALQGTLKPEEFQQLPAEVQLKLSEVMQKRQAEERKNQLYQQIFGQQGSNNQTGIQPQQGQMSERMSSQQGVVPAGQPIQSQQGMTGGFTDEQIAYVATVDPNLAKVMQSQKEAQLRQQKEATRGFEADRAYQTGFSKEAEKKVESIRDMIPRKETALDMARNAVETGELGAFSKDRLSIAIGGPLGDALRTAKGSQLITASKENLLSNMGRMSARAQNLWMEQRLNSMFPLIGQSDEANLTIQEMLEGEVAQDKLYLRQFDKLAEQDEKTYGYVKKDIAKRAENSIKEERKEIFDRSMYRMREVEEKSKGLTALKKEVGKKVVRGTPLTMVMAKLYKDKFGDQALKVAQENGYSIPTIEQFQIYSLTPQEFREKINL